MNECNKLTYISQIQREISVLHKDPPGLQVDHLRFQDWPQWLQDVFPSFQTEPPLVQEELKWLQGEHVLYGSRVSLYSSIVNLPP